MKKRLALTAAILYGIFFLVAPWGCSLFFLWLGACFFEFLQWIFTGKTTFHYLDNAIWKRKNYD
jgi:hypothetical protein